MFNTDQSKMKTVDFIIVTSAETECPYCRFQNYYNCETFQQNCRKCYKAYLVDCNAESIYDSYEDGITDDFEY